MSLTFEEYDEIASKLNQAQAITLLIAQASTGGMEISQPIHTAAYLVDDMLSEVHAQLRQASGRKRKRTS